MSASGQKTDVKFALPVTYDSGAPGAGSVAVADLRGNGKLDLVVAKASPNNTHLPKKFIICPKTHFPLR